MKKKEKIIITIISLLLIIITLLLTKNYARFMENNLTISKGETQKLQIKTNIKNYYCTSENENFVRVLNTCDIYGVETGTTNIILKAGNEEDKIKITVENKNYFTFNETNHIMQIGENYKLNYTTNIENISFNVSNDNVIIKDNIVYALKKGTTTISFKNNEIYEEIKITINSITLTATINKGNSVSVSENKVSCTINEKNGTCNITLPYIETNDNYQVIGFKNNNKIYKEGQLVSINKNETFTAYVIENNKITINYEANGANIEKTSDYCYKTSCTFKLPQITRQDYQILGYSLSKDATSPTYQVGQTISINTNTTLYAITKKTITATFLNNEIITLNKPNNNYTQTESGLITKCTIYNKQEYCSLIAPQTAQINGNYEFIGLKKESTYKPGETIYLNKNTTFQSIYKAKNEAKDITIYVSSTGKDTNTGLSTNSKVKTLSKVQEILKNSVNIKNVYIKIDPGTYENEHIVWTYYNGYAIRFMSSSKEKPIFKGGESSLPWFSLSLSNTSLIDIKLSFYNLQIENYFTAININGGTGKLKNITIDNITFNNIGNRTSNIVYALEDCIKIKNATNVSITNNKFTNLLNNTKTSKKMTAIRLNNTSNTLINKNTFTNTSGNTIILENSSNNNVILENTFTLSGYYAYIMENYKSSECLNNKVQNNEFQGSNSGYKIITVGILENNNLYYNEEISDKTLYNNQNINLIKKDISSRIKKAE